MLFRRKTDPNSFENADKIYDHAIKHLEDGKKFFFNQEKNYISDAVMSFSYAMQHASTAKKIYENIAKNSQGQDEKQRALNDVKITKDELIADIKWFQNLAKAEKLMNKALKLGKNAEVAIFAFKKLKKELKPLYNETVKNQRIEYINEKIKVLEQQENCDQHIRQISLP